jgi:hypothetical protein
LKKQIILLPIIFILFLQLCFVYPILNQFFKNPLFDLSLLISNQFVRTLLYTVFTSCLIVFLSFIFSIILIENEFNGLKRIMPLALFPALLGNVTISYLVSRSSLFLSFFEGRSYWSTFATLSIIDIWQYGLLFMYLFWFQLKFIPVKTNNFSMNYRFNLKEKVKLIYWPQTKNLTILLLIIGFILCLNESSKTSIIFRASEATETEFLSHFFSRVYLESQQINHTSAINKVLKRSSLVILPILVCLCFYILLMSKLFKRVITGTSLKKLWYLIDIIPSPVYKYIIIIIVFLSSLPFINLIRDLFPINIEALKIVWNYYIRLDNKLNEYYC